MPRWAHADERENTAPDTFPHLRRPSLALTAGPPLPHEAHMSCERAGNAKVREGRGYRFRDDYFNKKIIIYSG